MEAVDSTPPAVKPSDTNTPEETIQSAHAELNAALAEKLLAKVLDCDPDFFE